MDRDTGYLIKAYKTAAESPDLSTQNGAVIRTVDGRLVRACNELPYRVAAKQERLERPLKYQFTEHAERNAIYFAARHGIRLEGSTMYVPWFACADCARAIIQSGIIRVVGHKQMMDGTPEHWKESIARAFEMLGEAGIETKLVDAVLGGPKIKFNGMLWQP